MAAAKKPAAKPKKPSRDGRVGSAAPKGNQYWRNRRVFGREFKFTPEKLWDAACAYFDWVEENPLYDHELVKFQGTATLSKIPKMRAMTLNGMCLYINISKRTYEQYRHRENYADVCEAIDEVIKTQKFEGAAAEMLNPNLISKDLGLADKTELSGPGGGPIEQSGTVEIVFNPVGRNGKSSED